MPALDPKLRRDLEAKGQWADYVKLREHYKALGMAPKDARAKTFSELGRGTDGKTREPQLEPGGQSDATDLGDTLEAPIITTSLADFGDREASEVEIIRWVVRYMDVADIKPEHCPDPAAWTYLNECRKSPAFRSSFLLQVWPKIVPSRAQLEDVAGRKFDGAADMEIIDQIIAARERAQGGVIGNSGESYSLVPGSSPGPATNGEPRVHILDEYLDAAD